MNEYLSARSASSSCLLSTVSSCSLLTSLFFSPSSLQHTARACINMKSQDFGLIIHCLVNEGKSIISSKNKVGSV
jgi:hypothetical protein